MDPEDPDFRRLKYVRYADDFLLGFIGPKHEAEEIESRIREFLTTQLGLELSDAKTLITHGRTAAARFLGYEIVVSQNDDSSPPAVAVPTDRSPCWFLVTSRLRSVNSS